MKMQEEAGVICEECWVALSLSCNEDARVYAYAISITMYCEIDKNEGNVHRITSQKEMEQFSGQKHIEKIIVADVEPMSVNESDLLKQSNKTSATRDCQL